MKQTIQGFLLAGTLLLGGAALAQEASKAQGKGAAKGGTAEFHGFMVPTDEKAFLERIHHINQTEIKLGQLAQQNASNPDVKSYGEQMVRDHTAADQRVTALAQSRGLKLADMPKPMNDVEKKSMAAQKANMEKLQALKGEPFDSCYMASMVGDHDEALGKLMAGQQALTGNAELTSVVGDLSQTIAQQRQKAYTLLGKVGPQAMGMGVGGAGGDKGTSPQPGSESGMGGHMGTQPDMGGHMGTGQSGSGTQQPKK